MSNTNPYQAPDAHIQVPAETAGELASRGSRFGAAMIDGIISLIFVVPLMLVFGIWAAMTAGQEPSLSAMTGYVVSAMTAYLLINGYLLHSRGQSVGKKLMGIRIVDMQGNNPGLVKLFFVRYVAMSLVWMLPLVGGLLGLIDVLMIFKGDRRCGHDMVAGTQVVNA